MSHKSNYSCKDNSNSLKNHHDSTSTRSQKKRNAYRTRPANFDRNYMKDIGQSLKRIDWTNVELPPFQKSFYVESDTVRNRSQSSIDEFRESSQMTLIGKDIPKPVESFEEAGFPENLLAKIKALGFAKPTPIQCQGWPMALSGRNVIGVAQTGSGKTLSFCLPAILHMQAQPPLKKGDGPIALVLAPTRELAIQIHNEFTKYGSESKLRSTVLSGGAPKGPQESALRYGVELIVATPGRLIDMISSSVTNLRRVTYFVLDEADRMLDMGLEPQLRSIFEQIRPDRQILMWSATWPKEVEALANDYLNDYIQVIIGSINLSSNHYIKQIVYVCELKEKILLFKQIMEEHVTADDKVIIFTATKAKAEALFRKMSSQGWAVMALHGDKYQYERDIILRDFRSGKCQVLIATDIVSRGLDVSDVKIVVNFDYPSDTETYVHRIGRTGRAGNTGIAFTLFTSRDSNNAASLVDVLQEAKQDIPSDLLEFCKGKRKIN